MSFASAATSLKHIFFVDLSMEGAGMISVIFQQLADIMSDQDGDHDVSSSEQPPAVQQEATEEDDVLDEASDVTATDDVDAELAALDSSRATSVSGAASVDQRPARPPPPASTEKLEPESNLNVSWRSLPSRTVYTVHVHVYYRDPATKQNEIFQRRRHPLLRMTS